MPRRFTTEEDAKIIEFIEKNLDDLPLTAIWSDSTFWNELSTILNRSAKAIDKHFRLVLLYKLQDVPLATLAKVYASYGVKVTGEIRKMFEDNGRLWMSGQRIVKYEPHNWMTRSREVQLSTNGEGRFLRSQRIGALSPSKNSYETPLRTKKRKRIGASGMETVRATDSPTMMSPPAVRNKSDAFI